MIILDNQEYNCPQSCYNFGESKKDKTQEYRNRVGVMACLVWPGDIKFTLCQWVSMSI